MLISILVVLLYALVAVLILELIFVIVELFLPVPPRIRKIAYAIVGVLILIWILQVVLGGASLHFPGILVR